MRSISLMAAVILLFFTTSIHAERTLTDEEIAQVAFLFGLTESSCDLIDLFFTDDMTKIEIYECVTWRNGQLVFASSGRFAYIDGAPAVPEPMPLPGQAVALISKVT